MTEMDPVEMRLAIARRMADGIDELVERMMTSELSSIPALGRDAAFLAEVRASNRANAEAIIALLSSPAIVVGQAQVPAAALDVVRSTVRRGLDLESIYAAYRRGQSVMWDDFMRHVSVITAPTHEVVGFLADSSALMFDYIDRVITQLIAAAQHERDEILGGALARRVEAVRLILDGAPMDVGAANDRLGYDVRRCHTGVVVWSEPGATEHGNLESIAARLARAIGARPPLTVAAGVSSVWAWMATSDPPDREALRAAATELPTTVRIAVGPSRSGLGGFRQTHAGALEIHDLLAGQGGTENVALHEDYEVTLLAGRDVRTAAAFVQRVLGGLADDTPAAERLRESVRVFLDEGGNAPRTAARLYTHRNTVLQRIERATELIGHRPEANRLALSVALELARRLGQRVLSPA